MYLFINIPLGMSGYANEIQILHFYIYILKYP